MVLPMIGIVYHDTMPPDKDIKMNVATLIGIILGQALFGVAADVWGRSKVYGLHLIFIIAGCLGMATTSISTNGIMSLLSMLMLWRFVLGLGIGGDYPLSAVITSEY